MLGLPLLGVIPDSKQVLTCSNMGQPVIASETKSDAAAQAFDDAVARFLGEEREMRFLKPQRSAFVSIDHILYSNPHSII